MTNASAPCSPTRSMASTGMMVAKMPANRIATSLIGSQVNWFSSHTPRRRPPGRRQHEDEDRVAHEVLHLLRDAEDRHLAEVHGPGEDDGGQHAAEEEDVVPALHPDRLAGPGRPRAEARVLAAPPVEVEEQVRAEDGAR